jgi:major membrane immunogen (membrane-anchored lipoprotein)
MGGLAKLCKLYGSVEVSGQDGKKIVWVWDYAQDKPRLKSEMTDEEIRESEKAKWIDVKNRIEQEKQEKDEG